MRIEVTGRHLDVGDALRAHVAEGVQEAAAKYASRAVNAHATISKDAHWFVCDCTVSLSSGLTAQSSGKSTEVYAACDQAMSRLEKQLRRHKRRLRDHHQRRAGPVARIDADAYVLDAGEDERRVEREPNDAGDDEALWSPAIIAESKTAIPALSVGEAVMQMELNGDAFLLFFNETHGRLNVVHRRADGAVGWIDPPASAA